MFLTNKEKEMFNNLGFEVRDDKISKIAKPLNLEYAGFNVYLSTENGRVFEKVGGSFEEISNPELNAEQRFLKNNS